MRWQWFIPAALCLFITACASSQDAGDSSAANQVSFLQVKTSPDSFKGQSVVFGGEVLNARRLKDGTRIEILQLPLDGSGHPGIDRTQSQGRFVAMHREFLDPATLPYGTRVTVTGEITGSITLPLDETEYMYPVVEARQLQVWTTAEYPARTRPYPYMGPRYYGTPYWGPYWGPYWRRWPYGW